MIKHDLRKSHCLTRFCISEFTTHILSFQTFIQTRLQISTAAIAGVISPSSFMEFQMWIGGMGLKPAGESTTLITALVSRCLACATFRTVRLMASSARHWSTRRTTSVTHSRSTPQTKAVHLLLSLLTTVIPSPVNMARTALRVSDNHYELDKVN